MNMNITEYGTVKWNTHEEVYYDIYGGSLSNTKKHEISINKFLRKLSYRVNKGGPYLDDDNNATLEYDAFVYQSGEDRYCIKFNYNKHYENYELCIKDSKEYYPLLKEKLDELAEFTKQHDKQAEIVKNGECGKNLNVADTKIYLKYLHDLVKRLNIYKALVLIGAILGIFGMPFSCWLIGTYKALISVIPLILSLVSIITLILILIEDNSILSLPFRMAKIMKLKIKRITKLLAKKKEVSLKVNNELKKEEVKQDVYKNSIINYMSTIMDGANKLSKSERRQKLLELRDILDEYTNKCQELCNSSTKLTLTDSERNIAIQTLDKLTTLEMEIAEMIRRDTESSKITLESDILRKKIDDYLAIVSDDEKEISTKKPDGMKKVRVHTM